MDERTVPAIASRVFVATRSSKGPTVVDGSRADGDGTLPVPDRLAPAASVSNGANPSTGTIDSPGIRTGTDGV